MNCQHCERHLDAYVDGELDPETEASIRDHLDDCVECRRSADGRETLGRLVRMAPYYDAPQGLRARVSARTAHVRARRGLLAWAAAAVVVISAGAGAALWRTTSRDAVFDRVVDNHVRSMMADHLFDVRTTDAHTVKPWFLGKLDFSPPVVDLAPIGYPLVGGRLEYLDGRPAAALVYQRNLHTINLFVTEDRGGASAPGARTVRGFHVRHWVREGLSFWAVSDIQESSLGEFVSALQGT